MTKLESEYTDKAISARLFDYQKIRRPDSRRPEIKLNRFQRIDYY